MLGAAPVFAFLYILLVLGGIAVVLSAMFAVHAIRKDVSAIRQELTWLSERIESGPRP